MLLPGPQPPGLEGDLLAAQALGVVNVMAVTGEEITHGDHHQARAVDDLNLLELLGAIQTLQTGRDLGGVDLRGAPKFLVGATVKIPTSEADLAAELEDLDRKVAAGRVFCHPAGVRGGDPGTFPVC